VNSTGIAVESGRVAACERPVLPAIAANPIASVKAFAQTALSLRNMVSSIED
jgi:hypothetical protein